MNTVSKPMQIWFKTSKTKGKLKQCGKVKGTSRKGKDMERNELIQRMKEVIRGVVQLKKRSRVK